MPLKVGVFGHRALAVTVARRPALVVRRLDGRNHRHRLWLRLGVGMTVAMGAWEKIGEYGTCRASGEVHGCVPDEMGTLNDCPGRGGGAMLTGGSAGLSEMAGGGERGVGAVFERRGASM